jgi:hypothetical protein
VTVKNYPENVADRRRHVTTFLQKPLASYNATAIRKFGAVKLIRIF